MSESLVSVVLAMVWAISMVPCMACFSYLGLMPCPWVYVSCLDFMSHALYVLCLTS
jgi:hypothetical protein